MKRYYCIRRVKSNFNSLWDVYNFIHVFILISVTSVLLKLISVKNIIDLLSPKFKPRTVPENEILKLVRYTDYLLNISFLYFDTNCLKRSLVLFHMLRKKGIDVTLNLGVDTAHSDGNFSLNNINNIDGHAWLSFNNEIYLDKNPEITNRFMVVLSYP